MNRLSSSFLLSFTFHALIALSAITLYKEMKSDIPVTQTSVYVSLAHCVESLPVTQKQCDTPKASTPPIRPKKNEITKPLPQKAVVKSVPVIETMSIPLEAPQIEEPKNTDMVEEIQRTDTTTEDVVVKDQMPMEEKDEADHGHTSLMASPSIEERYLQEHMAMIARLLQENLYYPRSARKRGITGEVVVAFRLLQNGEASDIEVRSGKRAMLNRAAITTIERLSGEFPRPLESITLQVPIEYTLR